MKGDHAMAMTPADKQRAYRERQKEMKKAELRKGTPETEVFRAPFHEFFGGHGHDLDFDLALALAGIPAPTFDDDHGPEAFVLNDAIEGLDDPFNGATGASGRAEVMIGCLIDAAMSLAHLVNEYKVSEIKARMAEIEAYMAENSGEMTPVQALYDHARLQKMLDQLEKQVRWTFPQWKVTG
jgi:hypothetical protein